MKMKYKVEMWCILNTHDIYVIRKGYFQNKIDADIYKYKLLYKYYHSKWNNKTFNQYRMNEKIDKVEKVTKLIVYLYIDNPHIDNTYIDNLLCGGKYEDEI